jgi:hypothetical protein
LGERDSDALATNFEDKPRNEPQITRIYAVKKDQSPHRLSAGYSGCMHSARGAGFDDLLDSADFAADRAF